MADEVPGVTGSDNPDNPVYGQGFLEQMMNHLTVRQYRELTRPSITQEEQFEQLLRLYHLGGLPISTISSLLGNIEAIDRESDEALRNRVQRILADSSLSTADGEALDRMAANFGVVRQETVPPVVRHTCPMCGFQWNQGDEPCAHQFHMSPSFHPVPLQRPVGQALLSLPFQYGENSPSDIPGGEHIQYPAGTRVVMKLPKEKKRSRYDIALGKDD